MPVAGVVVVPLRAQDADALSERLSAYEEVEVQGYSAQGIALVMESPSLKKLKDLSEEIGGWEDVIEFNLAYLNWEDQSENPGQGDDPGLHDSSRAKGEAV